MIHPDSHGILDEGDGGPAEDGQRRQGGDDHQESPDLRDSQGMVAGVALGEQGMTVGIVPNGQGLVEAFATQREVQGLYYWMQEEEHGYGVGREVVGVVGLFRQVYSHHDVLKDYQEQGYLKFLGF